MSALVLAHPGQEPLGRSISAAMGAGILPASLRRFPDGESHARLEADASGCDVVIACTLDRPDDKLVPLSLLARAARDNGARRVVLAAPYLPYMRQDCVFTPGEGIASRAFGALLSATFDGVITVDPHLHRHGSLGEVLSVPSRAASSSAPIAAWIAREVPRAVIVGPDEESAQWASAVAELAGCEHLVLRKRRVGDHDVEIEAPDRVPADRVPVIVDDILSTGGTLAKVVLALRARGSLPPVAIAVHAVFARDPRERLREAGLGRLVTCNSIAHETNAIDIVPEVARGVTELLADPLG